MIPLSRRWVSMLFMPACQHAAASWSSGTRFGDAIRYPPLGLGPLVDPAVRLGNGRDMRRQTRFTHHMQPPDLRHMLGDAGMIIVEIVDEHSDTGRAFREQARDRRALAAPVAIDRKVEAMPR